MNKEHVKKLFSTFNENGYELYIVGGAVRDMLLGESVNDIDFTTNALPEEIEGMFESTLSVGARYGTIQVLLDGEYYEITTYRSEGDYKDSRHPSKLSFGTDLKADLERRDFTVNALALDQNGCIIDCHGGFKDLKAGMIKTINSPEERFGEDQLRKWRCIRFATQKGFEIDEKTYSSLVYDPDTSGISIERIREEFTKIILSEKVNWGGYLLVRTGLYRNLLRRLLPEYDNRHFEVEDLIYPFEVMHFLPVNLSLRLAALALGYDFEDAKTLLNGLGYSKQLVKEALDYYSFFETTIESGIKAYKRAGALIGREGLKNLFTLQKTYAYCDQDRKRLKGLDKTGAYLEKIIKNEEPLTRAELSVNGTDLKAFGLEGRKIGETLDYLLEYVYENPKENTKAKLLELTDKFLRDNYESDINS